jgi:extradiol dioxygenase family protein
LKEVTLPANKSGKLLYTLAMIKIKRLDHFLISIPEGKTSEARTFYSEIIGLDEIPGNHPKGAIWFNMGDIQLHIREEKGQQISDRHPAFEIEDLGEAKAYLESKGVTLSYSSDIDGRQRFFIRDPFDNRIEFLEYLN